MTELTKDQATLALLLELASEFQADMRPKLHEFDPDAGTISIRAPSGRVWARDSAHIYTRSWPSPTSENFAHAAAATLAHLQMGLREAPPVRERHDRTPDHG